MYETLTIFLKKFDFFFVEGKIHGKSTFQGKRFMKFLGKCLIFGYYVVIMVIMKTKDEKTRKAIYLEVSRWQLLKLWIIR